MRRFAERLFKAAAHCIERLVHVLEIRRIQTLEANEHALAAAAHEQFQKLFIVCRVDAGLAHPTNLQWNQCAEKFFRLLNVRGDVVVHEEKQFTLALQRFDFRDDVVNGTARLSGVEDSLNGAKVAFEMTAASGFNQADGQITLAVKD